MSAKKSDLSILAEVIMESDRQSQIKKELRRAELQILIHTAARAMARVLISCAGDEIIPAIAQMNQEMAICFKAYCENEPEHLQDQKL